MKYARVQFDAPFFSLLFSICGKLQNRTTAKQIFDEWEKTRLSHSESSVVSAVSMFIKCSMLEKARQISLVKIITLIYFLLQL